MAETVVLYTTAGCHLCEEAATLLNEAGLPQQGWQVQAVDIASDAALVDAYGIRIPVLRHAASGSELGWPFDAAALQQWLRDCSAPV